MSWWIVDDAPILGGAELFGLRLARHLLDAGEDAAILAPDGSELAGRARQDGVPTRHQALPRLVPASGADIPAGLAAMRRTLRAARAAGAVVVANTAGAQAYCAIAAESLRRRPPVVHLLHEQLTAARPSARAVFRRGGGLVATGANTAAAYRAVLPGRSIHQLNNFLAREAFAGAAPRAAAGPVDVAALGRMIPEKGIAELVDELAAAPGSWAAARIAAPPQDDRYAAEVRRRIRAHGLDDRVTLLDWAEPLALLDAADVLVMPSTGLEGQPTVILEALARRRPVVVRAPSWSEDFAGLPVVPYTGPDDLGAALERLPAFPDTAAELARERFGPEQAVAALRAAARDAVSRRAGRRGR